jgi:hypothetical protein
MGDTELKQICCYVTGNLVEVKLEGSRWSSATYAKSARDKVILILATHFKRPPVFGKLLLL